MKTALSSLILGLSLGIGLCSTGCNAQPTARELKPEEVGNPAFDPSAAGNPVGQGPAAGQKKGGSQKSTPAPAQ